MKIELEFNAKLKSVESSEPNLDTCMAKASPAWSFF